jgi:Protein of unknown function (DUF833).
MCTMTWFVSDQGYELFFNRDERISRSRAQLPSIQTIDNIQYISPTDTDAGGTWVAANQFGVTVCLLNHYQFEQIETYKAWISRGEIVRMFASTDNLFAAERQFKSMDLNDYRAFRMFIISPDGQNRLLVWDGHRARVEVNVTKPKSSSSVDARHVKKMRKDLFENLGMGASKEVEDYLNYHASHLPSRSKESVCMHRQDANTVSFSHVSVDAHGVHFRYADGSPCEAQLGEPLSIDIVSENHALQAQIAAVK